MASLGAPSSWKSNIESSIDLLFAADSAKTIRVTLSTATRRGPQQHLWEAVQPNVSTLLENEHSLSILESLLRYGTPETVGQLCDALARVEPAVLPTLVSHKHGCQLVAAAIIRVDAEDPSDTNDAAEEDRAPRKKAAAATKGGKKGSRNQKTASGRALLLAGLPKLLTAEAFIEHGAVRTICAAAVNNEELAAGVVKTVFKSKAVVDYLVKELTECIETATKKAEQKQKKAQKEQAKKGGAQASGSTGGGGSKKLPELVNKVVGMQRNCLDIASGPISEIILSVIGSHTEQLFLPAPPAPEEGEQNSSNTSHHSDLHPLTVLLTAVAETGDEKTLSRLTTLLKKNLTEGERVVHFSLQQPRAITALFSRSSPEIKKDFTEWFFSSTKSNLTKFLESFDGATVLTAARESGGLKVIASDDDVKLALDVAQQRVQQRKLGAVAATAEAISRRKREREEGSTTTTKNGPSTWGTGSKLANSMPLLEISDSDDDEKPAVAKKSASSPAVKKAKTVKVKKGTKA